MQITTTSNTDYKVIPMLEANYIAFVITLMQRAMIQASYIMLTYARLVL